MGNAFPPPIASAVARNIHAALSPVDVEMAKLRLAFAT
jgi:hypothetical protein